MSELWRESLHFFSDVVSLHCGGESCFHAYHICRYLKIITCFSISFIMFIRAINHYMVV
jgi:hypothetical protein